MDHLRRIRSVRRPVERLHRLFDLPNHAGGVVETIRFVEAERRSVLEQAAICARLDARRADW
jgi:hypothetical protein